MFNNCFQNYKQNVDLPVTSSAKFDPKEVNINGMQSHLATANSGGRSKGAKCKGPATLNIKYLFQASSFHRDIKTISFHTVLLRVVGQLN